MRWVQIQLEEKIIDIPSKILSENVHLKYYFLDRNFIHILWKLFVYMSIVYLEYASWELYTILGSEYQ
jgi:hypothetical protein